MNYLILKNILDATIANFRCQGCQEHVTAKDINILGATATGLSLEITCPKCAATGVIKAEVNVVGSLQKNTEFLDHMKRIFQANGGHMVASGDEQVIRDEDIVSLRKRLKEGCSVEDIFKL